MIYRVMVLLLTVATLTSCSMLSPVKVIPTNKFVLYPMSSEISEHAKRKGVIVVAVPEMQPAFNTTQIAYTKTPFQIEYFAQNEWAENPPQMIQSLLVAGLEKSSRFQAVVTPPFSAHYDYLLETQVERFIQRLSPGIPAFEVVMRLRLINANTNRVILTRLLCATIAHRYTTPYSSVIAANLAMDDIVTKVINLTSYDKKRRSSR